MTEKINPILLDFPNELSGARIVVRPYVESDAPALWDAIEASRTHLAPWMPWLTDWKEPEFARVVIRKNAAKWIMREDLTMGMFERRGENASGRLLGGCGLHRFDWSVPAMEIGYWLRPDAEGKGYVSEMVKLLTGFAFAHLKAERVEIRCDAVNTRSAAVPRRLGFKEEALLRSSRRNVEGVLGDTLVFAMTRADYVEDVE